MTGSPKAAGITAGGEMANLAARVAKLSPEQRAVFLRRLAQQKAAQRSQEGTGTELPRARSRDGWYPLSFAQERIWFIQQLAPDSTLYHIPSFIHHTGSFEVEALRWALHRSIERHPILRTRFAVHDGEPQQAIEPASQALQRIEIPVIDLGALPEDAREPMARRWIDREVARPFDLQRGPLLRLMVFRFSTTLHWPLTVMHHLISDGLSGLLFHSELWHLYGEAVSRGAKRATLRPKGARYVDFAVWQHQRYAAGDFDSHIEFWRQRLTGPPPVLELPSDRPRSQEQSFRGSLRALTLPPKQTAALETFARDRGRTVFVVLLSVFQALMYRHTGQTDLCLGVGTDGRSHAALGGTLGCLINTLVLRTDFTAPPHFNALIEAVHRDLLEVRTHQAVPFEKVVEALQPERALGHTPFFQVVANQAWNHIDKEDLDLRAERPHSGATHFDLTFEVRSNQGGEQLLAFEYNADLFDASTVERWIEHFRNLLEVVLEAPEAPLGHLPLLSSAERGQVLADWGAVPEPQDHDRVDSRCLAYATQDPQRLAVIDHTPSGATRPLTYGELDQHSAALARHLEALGAGPETVVAVALPRSADLVITLLAILRTGAAYLPVSPEIPPKRLDFQCTNAGVMALVDSDFLETGLLETGLLKTSERSAQAEDPGPTGPRDPVADDALAYVIYTSGSTGHPKGIEISHRGLARLAGWHRQTYGLGNGVRTTLVAGVGFDASVWEIWSCLAAGATLCIPPSEALALPSTLETWLADTGVHHSFLPTPLLEACLAEGALAADRVPQLREILTGGDRLHRRSMDGGWRLINHYGPTECSVVATCGDVAATHGPRLPSIGRPLGHVRAVVLDTHGGPAPIGVPGELCLGGPALARGYRRRPGLTAEYFVPDPWGPRPGDRLYRTGDLARREADGRLTFLRRIDHQVKVRGFRIELGEIEAALAELDEIREAVVVPRQDAGDDTQLVAYVTRHDTPSSEAAVRSEPLPEGWRPHLLERLPAYMVPSLFVGLDALPLNTHGKVDRKALPWPLETSMAQRPTGSSVPPTDELETRLRELWLEVLPVDDLGVEDNFFDLGGHSLLMMKLFYRLQGEIDPNLTITTLFHHPTIRALARHLGQTETATDGVEKQRLRAQKTRQAMAVRRSAMERQRAGGQR